MAKEVLRLKNLGHATTARLINGRLTHPNSRHPVPGSRPSIALLDKYLSQHKEKSNKSDMQCKSTRLRMKTEIKTLTNNATKFSQPDGSRREPP